MWASKGTLHVRTPQKPAVDSPSSCSLLLLLFSGAFPSRAQYTTLPHKKQSQSTRNRFPSRPGKSIKTPGNWDSPQGSEVRELQR